jgi:beta-ureidopropionase / N-carbamoyl-L-amino-acid hydrolase
VQRRHFPLALAGAIATLASKRATAAGARTQPPRVDGERLNRGLAELARFGRNDLGGVTRVAYGDADVAARAWVTERMRAAGLDVSIDAAGNIVGRREGTVGGLPPLMTGSHIDSVPEGGAYDGCVGALGAVEVAWALSDHGVALRHPLEVVIFQNEENGKVGSRALEGEDPASYMELRTHSGKTVREGIRFIGGEPDRIAEARREPGSIAAFVELHIEQGAVLEAAGLRIGVVEGIVGIKRWLVSIEGFANHAGTTPMDRRRDALLAAARYVDAVHRIARARPGRHVATVGSLEAHPGAPNVIAGRAELTLEIRDLDLERVDGLHEELSAAAARIAEETGTRFAEREIYLTLPAAADAGVQDVIERAAADLRLPTMRLPSGAGHDAQEIARLAPMGMIFVPSRGGISHSAEEFSAPGDITAGADVLLRTIVALDAR